MIRARRHLMLRAVLCALATAAALPVAAQDADQVITVDAGSWQYDRKNSLVSFEAIRVTQGDLGIDADTAESSNLDFENATWHFRGNVRISGTGSDIRATEASLRFRDNVLTSASILGAPAIFRQSGPNRTRVNAARAELDFKDNSLTNAVLTGSPATFEGIAAEGEEPTFGEAREMAYDFVNGVVTMTNEARLTDGTNQITGGSIRYDTRQQRVIAGSEGGDGQRVQITITPPPDEEPTLPELPDQDPPR
ncbi:MAG: LptA/OstA family protein [Pseudomonadota bacterium]